MVMCCVCVSDAVLTDAVVKLRLSISACATNIKFSTSVRSGCGILSKNSSEIVLLILSPNMAFKDMDLFVITGLRILNKEQIQNKKCNTKKAFMYFQFSK